MMMFFRILFLLISLAFLFSCKGRTEKEISTSDIVKRKLFDIKSVGKIMPGNGLMYYKPAHIPLFWVTLKNISNFDLNIYYHKGIPMRAAACIEYINYPSTAECMFEADTSFLIKKNDEFMVKVPLWMSDSAFHRHEYQGIKFKILISSYNDLSFYFEHNSPDPHYSFYDPKDTRKKYVYPFEFIYWDSNDIFWENHLLE